MTRKNNFLKIDFNNRSIELGVSVFMFIEGDHEIACIPALKLSAYGKTKSEAPDMLTKDVLDDFFKNLFGLETEAKIIGELMKYGWKRHGVLRREFNAPVTNGNSVIKQFNLPGKTELVHEFLRCVEKIAA